MATPFTPFTRVQLTQQRDAAMELLVRAIEQVSTASTAEGASPPTVNEAQQHAKKLMDKMPLLEEIAPGTTFVLEQVAARLLQRAETPDV